MARRSVSCWLCARARNCSPRSRAASRSPSRPIKFRQSRQYHEALRCVPHLLAQLAGTGVGVPNFQGREGLGDLQRLTQRNLHVQFVLRALRSVWQRLQHLQPFRECVTASTYAERALLRSPARCQYPGRRCKASLSAVMRQQFGLCLHRLGIRCQRLGKLCMVALPRARQQRLIGYLLGQGMLEGVGALREQACLVEELGGLKMRQATALPPRVARQWPGAMRRAPRCR